ncbi:MFS transporter [Roseixanthobacter glucoisosaccharinicivorans]|uniref:MFS transporter n=1 Tax=Roseixanthobacter glucoisosaccharinicivorans TaxID=3119923 RepID=UPI00372ADD26
MRLPGSGPFRSLRNHNYRLWAAGALLSNIGTAMQRTAQDWLVLTYLTAHSAAAVGLVMALQFGPQLLLLPWTGSAADHFNQRRLLMATQASMGVLGLGLGMLTLSGAVALWHVYVFAFLSGCAAAFDAPVRQTFVAELVGDADLPNAVALNSTLFTSAQMFGPAIAGLTIAGIGTGWAFVIDGASFGAVLAALLLLRVHELRPNARAHRAKGSFVEGIRYVRGRPDLRMILLMLFLIGTFGMNFPIFTSTMAVMVFHVDARGFGLLSSIMAVGALTGALVAAARREIGFRTLLGGAAVFGLGCGLAAMAPGYWLFAAALPLAGAALLTFANATNGLMQLTTEPSMRGRVMALRIAIALGCTPLGAPLVGWVADTFGPRWSMGVGAASGFAAAAVAAVFLIRSSRRAAPSGL